MASGGEAHRARWPIATLMARPGRDSGTARPILLHHGQQQGMRLSGQLGVGRANASWGPDPGQGSPPCVHQHPGRPPGMAGGCDAVFAPQV